MDSIGWAGMLGPDWPYTYEDNRHIRAVSGSFLALRAPRRECCNSPNLHQLSSRASGGGSIITANMLSHIPLHIEKKTVLHHMIGGSFSCVIFTLLSHLW